jgi:hypothetical protein
MQSDTLDTVEAKEEGKIVISNARRYTLLALVSPVPRSAVLMLTGAWGG